MIHHVFVFGVILPTVITILVFLAFLVCWFKFNMKERFFKKHLIKRQKKKQSVAGQPLENVPAMQAYRQDRDGTPPPGEPPRPDHYPPGPPNGFGVHGSRSRSSEFPEDTCSIEDPEAALCSHIVAVDRSKYFPNSTAELQSELQMLKCPVHHQQETNVTSGLGPKNLQRHHVAQTFHFPPPLNKKHQPFEQVDLCDEDLTDEGNYGHFVPLSDVMVDDSAEKNAQHNAHHQLSMPAEAGSKWSQKNSSPYSAESCKGLDNGLVTTNSAGVRLVPGM